MPKLTTHPQLQPPTMPRPDLTSLSISYRRIPILSIGSDIYLDTRLILQTLDRLFPPSRAHPALTPDNPSCLFIERLLESWTVDGGVFSKAAMLIPSHLPLLRDEGFRRDRDDYAGRRMGKEEREKGREEALRDVERWAGWLEDFLVGDGRSWLLAENEGPMRADIEGKLLSYLICFLLLQALKCCPSGFHALAATSGSYLVHVFNFLLFDCHPLVPFN